METITDYMYQEAIEQLVLEGYTILQVIEPHTKESLYFNVYKWQEGYFNTAQSIDFNTVEGVNITNFLAQHAVHCSNRTNFINQFNKTLTDGVLVRCEFAKNTPWYKWSAPNGIKKQ